MHESKNTPANTLIRQVLSLENNSAKYLHKASFQYTMHDSKNTQPNTLIRQIFNILCMTANILSQMPS